jgi:predicted TIM-barrel fold metal-dependent hydrolase
MPAAAPAGGRIDLHAHHIPPDYRVALLEAGQLTIAGYPTPVWTPQRALGFMDNYGIGTQVLSLSDPGVSFLSGTKAASLARSVNEYTAGLLAQYPTRFGGFAVLPLPDIDAALTELDYALNTLKLDGVGLLTSYAGQNIALPQFALIWEAVAAAGAFVFMHPATLPANEKPASPLPDFLVEFTFDTTRFVTLALYTGLFDLHPKLRIQLAHAGGCYPYLSWRVSVLTQGGLEQITQNPNPTLNGVLPGTPTKGLYYDTALSPAPQSMRSILEMSDLDHIVFGSDWPFTELLFLTAGDPQPQLSLSFDETQRHALERANALALLPSLARRLAAA